MNRHSIGAAAATFAAALAIAPAAQAATTRFVSPTGLNTAACTSGAPCDFTKVLTLTAAGDTITVKQGTYNIATGIGVNVPNVHIVGESGGAKPKINFTGLFPAGLGLSFSPVATGGEVRNLEFESTSGQAPVSATFGAVTVDGVTVTSSGGCVAGGPGSTIVNTKATQTPSAFGFGSCVSAGDNSTLRSVEVTTPTAGIGISFGAVTVGGGSTVDRLKTTGAGGLAVGSLGLPGSGATTTVKRSNLATTNTPTGAPAPALSANGPAVVTDTLLRSDNASALPGGSALSSASNVKLRNVTAIATGLGASGVTAQPLSSATTLSVKNSILRGQTPATDVNVLAGLPSPFLPGDPICISVPSICMPTLTPTVTIDHSNFRGATGTLSSTDNQTADPQFTSATDFHPKAGSPVIDAGVDDADNGTVDLDGKVRKQGSAVDLGAYEFAVAPPPVDNPQQPTTPSGGGEQPIVLPPAPDGIAPGLSGLGLTNKTFAVGSAATPVNAARAKKGTTFVYTLSETATTVIAIERADTGRRKGRSCVKATKKNRKAKKCTRYVTVGALTRSAPAGPNALPFSGRIGKKALKPAKYRASFVATDAAGNTSKPKTVGFKIVKR